MHNITLKGAVVAITGGGRGIGLATARRLARAGARVSIGDLDAELAQQAANELGGVGMALDVRDSSSFARWLAATEQSLGPVDMLINNAGIMPAGPFLEESDALSNTQIDVNLRGVIHGCKLALPAMVSRGHGQIVNVASMAGRLAVPGLAVYCATKFAVIGLTDTLREEYRDSGVTFTAILPAKVTTELAAGTDSAARGVPTVTADDVAAAIQEALEQRLTEVTLPRYLLALNPLQSAAPHWLLRGARRLFGDRRVLEKIDMTQRAGYDQRLAAMSKNH